MKLGRGTLRGINCTIRRRVDGRWIQLPVLGGLKVGISGERFLYDILKHFLPKLDGTVIDVGVNLGQTLCKVKLVDPKRSYYGFEPNASCHAYLDHLVRANAWSDVLIFPFGLSDQASILRFHLPPDAPTAGTGSFLPSLLPDGRREIALSSIKHAAVFSYSEVAGLIDERIAFLKIDVEGTELKVVRGMAEAIGRDEPIVALELIPDETLAGLHEQTMMQLQSLGYALFAIKRQSNKRWAGLEPIHEYTLPDNRSIADYLAIPQDKLSLLAGAPGSPALVL